MDIAQRRGNGVMHIISNPVSRDVLKTERVSYSLSCTGDEMIPSASVLRGRLA